MEATAVYKCAGLWPMPSIPSGLPSSPHTLSTHSLRLHLSPVSHSSFCPAFSAPSHAKPANSSQSRPARCASKADVDNVRYPNIPRLKEWAEGDGSRRLAAWEEAELPIPGRYQEEVGSRDPVLDNARQFRILLNQATYDGNNYNLIQHLGRRANREHYNHLPERLRYGPQPYMAATDEYEELMANKLVEMEPIFDQETLYRASVSKWMGQPSSREKRLQRYRARRAEVEAAKKGNA